ncbi:MAG: ABC transporter permease [Chloroflexi bacterium]|nr:ABC transporter permease [Chloroflexota bacterium]
MNQIVGFSPLLALKVFSLRIGQALLTVLGASVLIWALLPLTPGDPALRLLQARGVEDPLPAEIEAARAEMGLEQPLPLQFVSWLGRAVRGDLSVSYQSGKPVLEEFRKRAPATLMLAGVALALSFLFSIPAALVGAAYHERWPDQIVRFFTQIGATTPSFLAGLLVLYVVVLKMGWGKIVSSGEFGQVWLPAACLALARSARWTQLLRASLLESLSSHYILVARARGATKTRILLRYALPNAMLPFLTAVGVGIGALLGGSAIIEVVFTWPGLGSYMVSAISARDLPVIQGFVAINTLIYVGASLIVDVMTMLLDPRVRSGGNL